MKTFARNLTIKILAALIILIVPGFSQDQEKIVEEVLVENIEVPVRVFDGKKTVGNLKKEDFKLYVNGKETNIHGFYQVKRKIAIDPSAEQVKTKPKARLFVLIFNISDYNIDVIKGLDTFFEQILRKGDRFILISNKNFLPEKFIKNPQETKKQVEKILKKEIRLLKMEKIRMESELFHISSVYKARINDPEEMSRGDYPYTIFKELFENYLNLFDEYKKRHFGLTIKHYLRIAQYLKYQTIEKWILNFYQIGSFPKFSNRGKIKEDIDYFYNRSGEMARRVKSLIMNFNTELEGGDSWMVDNIGKIFYNSGATFHTLMMRPKTHSFITDYDYKPIYLASEQILRNLAKMSGGDLTYSYKIKNFLQDISEKEDICYMLTYSPANQKGSDIKITVSNQKYRIVYDNQNRSQVFRKYLKELQTENPQLEIKNILYKENMVLVIVNNIKLVENKNIKSGKIQATILVFDEKNQIRTRLNKHYKCKKSESSFIIKLPVLEKGTYDIVIEVKDLLAITNLPISDAIRIKV